MTEVREPRVRLPAPSHMGIVVKDLEQAVPYYESLFGWGPFRARTMDLKRFPGFFFRGQPAACRFRVAIGQSGSMVVELFQPLEGESPYAEFARARGEGLHHLGFHIDDVDGAVAALAQEGIVPVFHGKSPQGSFAYLDTDRIGGLVVELLNFSPAA